MSKRHAFKKYGKGSTSAYVVIFFAYNGPGPYKCFVCSDDVYAPWDENTADGGILVVHHKNENRHDDKPENLVPAHKSCHNFQHNKGKRRSDETKARISAARKGPHPKTCMCPWHKGRL